MATHNFYKAQGFRSEEIESQILVFDEPIPDNLPLNEWAKLATLQAAMICDVLTTTLAQGVTDRIIAQLMAQRATLFVFPMENKGND
jgi:hypothetical protein